MKWISVHCLHWSKIRFIHKYLARNLSFYKESLLKIKLWKGFHHIVPKVQKYPRVWKHPAASRVFRDEKPLFLRKCSFWEDREKNGKVGVPSLKDYPQYVFSTEDGALSRPAELGAPTPPDLSRCLG